MRLNSTIACVVLLLGAVDAEAGETFEEVRKAFVENKEKKRALALYEELAAHPEFGDEDLMVVLKHDVSYVRNAAAQTLYARNPMEVFPRLKKTAREELIKYYESIPVDSAVENSGEEIWWVRLLAGVIRQDGFVGPRKTIADLMRMQDQEILEYLKSEEKKVSRSEKDK